jgi:ferredoxin-type protein NapH
MSAKIRSLLPVRGAMGFSLPAAVLLTLSLGIWCYMFIVARSAGTARIAAWIIFGGVMVLFFLLLRTGQISRYRRYFFVAIALLFFPEFIGRLLETRGTMMLGAGEILSTETPYCHIVTSVVFLPWLVTGKIVFPAGTGAIASMLVIWGTATLAIGRGWCSWACFYGGWDDGMSRLARKPRLKIGPANKKIRYFGFAMLAFVALASLGTLASVYCDWLCPFKIVTEFGALDSLRSYAAFLMFVLFFFGFVIVLPFLTRKRFQCMSFCPMGAFQSLLGKFNLYRVRIDKDKCIGCRICSEACPTLSLNLPEESEGKRIPIVTSTCTRCGECMTACPKNAISYGYVFCRGKSLFGGWRERLEGRKGAAAAALRRITSTLDELLSARALFVYSGFFIGMVFLSSFGTGTLNRLIRLVVHGSFLLR